MRLSCKNLLSASGYFLHYGMYSGFRRMDQYPFQYSETERSMISPPIYSPSSHAKIRTLRHVVEPFLVSPFRRFGHKQHNSDKPKNPQCNQAHDKDWHISPRSKAIFARLASITCDPRHWPTFSAVEVPFCTEDTDFPQILLGPHNETGRVRSEVVVFSEHWG
jgi:hypothetical protein